MAGIRSLEPYARSVLRIVAGLTFSCHGLQKFLGLFGGMGPQGGAAHFFSLSWAAGVIETLGGFLLLLGLFTAPVAFLLSGEMAVAYFMAHYPRGFWPIVNHGELAVLYCFLWLYVSIAGAGPLSLDALVRKKGA